MLLNKKIIFKYKSLLKVLSFNISAINKSIWNIRNILRFIFFYIFKKSFFYHFIFYYKFLFLLGTIKKNIVSFPINLYILFSNYFLQKYLLLIKNSYITNNNNILNNRFLFFDYKCKKWNNQIVKYYNFYFFYKNYMFFLYIWLYSLKCFYFYSLNCSHLPIKKHFFVILRSPHKDKKSREKFKIKKLKKNLLIPSFLVNPFFFSTLINESILTKWNIHVKKS